MSSTALVVALIGATIDVPGDFARIQSAIDAASDGDTVLVQPGHYREAIDFKGKDIVVIAASGPHATVIDASGLESTSTVSFVSGEPPTATLHGFTVTGGSGTRVPAPAGGPADLVGGGIVTAGGAFPTIRRCVITGNAVGSATHRGYGGGVGCAFDEPLGSGGSATITECWIAGNQATVGGGGAARQPSLADYLFEVPGFTGELDVQDSVVEDNDAGERGGGVYGADSVVNSVISTNSAVERGGGLAHVKVVRDCALRENSAGLYGGGVYSYALFPAHLVGCVLLGNSAGSRGGGAYLQEHVKSYGSFLVGSCTFSSNQAPVGDGLSIGGGSGTTVRFCSFWDDRTDPGDELVLEHCILWGPPSYQAPLGPFVTATWCDVKGGWPGAGNIDLDPGFVNPAAGDLHLLPRSNCVDAGSPFVQALPPLHDIDGDLRPLGAAFDLGADELVQDCNGNGVPDQDDLASGSSQDCDDDNVPDECELSDCNANGIADNCEIAAGTSLDCDRDGVPDECQPTDCDGDGLADNCEIAANPSLDCDENGVLDACEPVVDCNGDGELDACQVAAGLLPDCNANGVPDECDLAAGTSADDDENGVPDECQVVLSVPADYGTIQAALDAALEGDTVRLADGTYSGLGNVNLDFAGKAVTLESEHGASACIIDGGGSQRGVVFDSGETQATRIVGITFTRCAAWRGAAIECEDASPTVRDCVFVANATVVAGGQGGAIATVVTSQMRIESCEFLLNVADEGGAIWCFGTRPTLLNCSFWGNAALGAAGGGALRAVSGAKPSLMNCIVWGNTAPAISLSGVTTLLVADFSDVEGGSAGVKVGNATLGWGPGMIAADPLHSDAPAGDLQLLPGSPCIDTGDPASEPDPDGTPADMGAHPYQPWKDLGGSLPGQAGEPSLAGAGSLVAGAPTDIELGHAAASTTAMLVVGLRLVALPFKGGVLLPDPGSIWVLNTDGAGSFSIAGPWPAGVPSAHSTYFQAWIVDAAGVQGFAASNGLSGTTR